MNHFKNSLIITELLELLPLHIFWKDVHGVYQGCNKIFALGLGFASESDVIGKTDYELPISKEISALYRQDDLSVMSGKVAKLNIEEEQTFIDGKKGYLLTNKVPLFNHKKNVIGVLGVYSDITERKKMEMDLKKSKEVAESANRAKTEFLANLSHDVKTPLQSINLLSSGLLEDNNLNEKNRRSLELILSCQNQLSIFF